MTTFAFSGFRITTSGSTPTAFEASSMTWAANSTSFRYQYTMDNAVAGAFSSITTQLHPGSQLHSVVLNNSLRVNLDTVASIGQWTWGANQKTTVMAIETAPGEVHYYALRGAALPVMTSLSDYNAFMASVTATTSLISAVASVFGPKHPSLTTLNDMTRANSYTATSEDDVIVGLNGIDNWSLSPLDLGVGNDQFTGTNGADWALGGTGNDSLNGGGGADTLAGQDGDDMLFGGGGADKLEGGNGNDAMDGGDGNDIMNGAAGDDIMYGGNANDRLVGGDGQDTLFGDDGRDVLDGGNGNDLLFGGLGDDKLNGAGGADVLHGDAGNDTLSGGGLSDTLYGGDGDDVVDGGADADFLFGGAGNDKLTGGAGNDELYGGADNDTISGGAGNDLAAGGLGNDQINGDAGNDRLEGDQGDDILRGGLGDDTLLGGEGNDTLNGGTEADWFVFGPAMGADTVQEFKADQFDRIYIGSSLAATAEDAFALAVQAGNRVVIDFGGGNTLTLNATTLANVENAIHIWDDAFAFLG